MIWIPVFIIAAIIVAVIFSLHIADSVPGRIFSHIITIPLFAGIGCFVGALAGVLLGMIGLIIIPTNTVTISETPIYSLSDQVQYEGRFVLGSGYVNSDLYIYYVSEEEVGKKIVKTDREYTTIVETDDESPAAIVTGERYRWNWINWIAIDLNESNDQTTLIVPTNTVTTEYNVDLK